MKRLAPLRILLTRPALQGESLATSIRAYGGSAVIFPTLEIMAVSPKKILAQTKSIDNYDFVVFLSPNAVRSTAAILHDCYPNWPTQTKIIAIGPGTAAFLRQQSFSVDYYPETNACSEGLLQLFPLRNPAQKNILILQGEGGRGYLGSVLAKRGAQVTTVDTYARRCPQLMQRDIPSSTAVNIILCTSTAGLRNLMTLLGPRWRGQLFCKQLLVISRRIAAYASGLGFVKPSLVSDNASDTAILKLLLAYAAKNGVSIENRNIGFNTDRSQEV